MSNKPEMSKDKKIACTSLLWQLFFLQTLQFTFSSKDPSNCSPPSFAITFFVKQRWHYLQVDRPSPTTTSLFLLWREEVCPFTWSKMNHCDSVHPVLWSVTLEEGKASFCIPVGVCHREETKMTLCLFFAWSFIRGSTNQYDDDDDEDL